AGVNEGVKRVTELGLGRPALKKLQVVDHQDVDGAQRLLECERILRPQRRDKAVHELLGGEIQHLALGGGVARPCQRLQQVRLPEAHARVNIERVGQDDLASPPLCEL